MKTNHRDELVQLLNTLNQDEQLDKIVEVVNKYVSKKHPEIENGIWKSRLGRIIAPSGIVLLLITSLMLTKILVISKVPQYVLDFISYGTWLIAPPIWFFIEYNILFPDPLKRDPILFDDLKYTQELASKIWAGIVVFISAILVSRYK